MKLKRTNSKEYNKALKSALIEMINTEYLGDLYDPKKPFTSIVKIAEIEKLYKDNRQNYLKDWLMGVPSALNLPFWKWEILEFIATLHDVEPTDFTEAEEDRLMGNFYNHIQFKIHSYAKKE